MEPGPTPTSSLIDIEQSLSALKGKTGRPRSVIWKHFDDIGRDPKSHRHIAKCKACGQTFPCARLNQLRQHLLANCRQVDSKVRSEYLESEQALMALEGLQPTLPSTNKKRRLTESVDSQGSVTTSLVSAEEVNGHMLNWLVQSDLSLGTASTHSFLRFIGSLNANYPAPSVSVLEDMMDKQARRLRGVVDRHLDNCDWFSIGLDGFTHQDTNYVCVVYVILADTSVHVYTIIVLPQDSHIIDLLKERLHHTLQLLPISKLLNILPLPPYTHSSTSHTVSTVLTTALSSLLLLPMYAHVLHTPSCTHTFAKLYRAVWQDGEGHGWKVLTTSHWIATTMGYGMGMAMASGHNNVFSPPLRPIHIHDLGSVFDCLHSVLTNSSLLRDRCPGTDQDFWERLECTCRLLRPIHHAYMYSLSKEASYGGCMAHYVHILHCMESLPPGLVHAHLLRQLNGITRQLNGSAAPRLCLFLHPLFREGLARSDSFRDLLHMASVLLKGRGGGEGECRALCTQLLSYRDLVPPFRDMSGSSCAKTYWLSAAPNVSNIPSMSMLPSSASSSSSSSSMLLPALLARMGALLAHMPVRVVDTGLVDRGLGVADSADGVAQWMQRHAAMAGGDLYKVAMRHALRLHMTHTSENTPCDDLQQTPSPPSDLFAASSSSFPSSLEDLQSAMHTHRPSTLLPPLLAAYSPPSPSVSHTTLLRLNGVDYTHICFNEHSLAVLGAAENHRGGAGHKRGVSGSREEFSVEDLIMEFDT
eukprot:gene27377-33067_t